MDAKGLQKLIDSGEGRFLEFKKKADHPDKIVREMVAFANSGGGTLLLGVEDSGKIYGLSNPDEEKFVMEAALNRYVKPEIQPDLEKIPVGSGKWVLKYRINDGKEKPYYWLEDREKNRFAVYVRNGEQSLRASYEMYRILRGQRNENQNPLVIGETESLLFSVLADGSSTSIPAFMKICGVSRKKISGLFISLVLNGVLDIEAGNGLDLFQLSENYLREQ